MKVCNCVLPTMYGQSICDRCNNVSEVEVAVSNISSHTKWCLVKRYDETDDEFRQRLMENIDEA